MTDKVASVTKSEISRRPMRPEESDLALFRACFARNNDRPRSMDLLRWQYAKSVTGKTFVDFALTDHETRVAAIYATLSSYLRVNGERRVALQSLDTLTDADFRGRGLFVSLAQDTFRRAAESGVALVYGFPNASSAHGFFKKLGWTPIDPVPMMLRPLRTGYFASRAPARLRPFASRLPDLPLSVPLPLPSFGRTMRDLTADDLDARATDLWNDFADGIGVAIERDATYLRWRLFDKPEETYTVRAVERDGKLEALVAFVVKEKHGGRIGYVMDLLHRRGQWLSGALLLRSAIQEMAGARADGVLAWCFTHAPNYRAYLANGFFPLPEKMRPIELHAGVRPFDESIAETVLDRSNWYLSYLDSDTV